MVLHVDLAVTDMATSLAFYTGPLGCVVVEDAVLHGAIAEFYSDGTARSMRIAFLKTSPSQSGGRSMSSMIELMEFHAEDGRPPLRVRRGREGAGLPSLCNISILVADLEDTIAKLEAAGFPAASQIIPIELPRFGKSSVAFVRDPDENLIELVMTKPRT